MDDWQRHRRNWRVLYALAHRWICRKFNLSHEDLDLDGPMLLISNHVSAWDPLLVAMSLPRKQTYYVASEHLFRLGLVTKLLERIVAPIPRRKASLGTDTVKSCLRYLKEGRSVCIFAEGEQCWTGENIPVFPATGKLARVSGASLVTFRIEGGYLSLPRWGKGVRRGRVRVGPVRVYSPEELKGMTPQEIDDAINRDIRESAWERQAADPVAYRGKRRAEGMEKALYLCPGCRRIDSLRTEGDRVRCGCGLDLEYTETGFFRPDFPFRHLGEWDKWQAEALRDGAFRHPEDPAAPLFSDGTLSLSRLSADHESEALGEGGLEQYADRLVCAGQVFPLAGISDMAAVQSHLLLLTTPDGYFEIRTHTGANLRKYLEFWKTRQ